MTWVLLAHLVLMGNLDLLEPVGLLDQVVIQVRQVLKDQKDQLEIMVHLDSQDQRDLLDQLDQKEMLALLALLDQKVQLVNLDQQVSKEILD